MVEIVFSAVERDPDVLDVRSAAEMLGVHPKSIYMALRSGRMPGRKVGRSWRLHRRALEEWLGTVEDPIFLDSDSEDEEDFEIPD